MNHPAPQKVLKTRRDDNIWLAKEMRKDNDLRRSRPAKAALEGIVRTGVSRHTQGKGPRPSEHTPHRLARYFPAPADLRLVRKLLDAHRPTGH